jgi:hypothetical protein
MSCTESLPRGAARPSVSESIASKSVAGYALPWTLKVTHAKGLRPVLEGLEGPASALRAAGFGIAQTGVQIETIFDQDTASSMATTTLTVPLMALPQKSGTQTLTLPQAEIAFLRASGDRLSVCTQAHAVEIADPSEGKGTEAAKENPAYRPEYEALMSLPVALGLLALLSVLALALVLFRAHRKNAPEPPVFVDRRPPWEIARHDILTLRAQTGSHSAKTYADAASDIVRTYLGARYKVRGIESTSPELLAALEGRGLGHDTEGALRRFFEETDMVKFANAQEGEREHLVRTALLVVDTTTPSPQALAPAGVKP